MTRQNTHCMVEGDNHSSDTVEVWHGYTTPAVGCGFHAMNYSSELFEAHRKLERSLTIAAAAQAPCPDHGGQWFHKSTGACSCGRSHSMLAMGKAS